MDINVIEDYAEEFLFKNTGPFSLEDLVDYISSETDMEKSEKLEDEIHNFISAGDKIFIGDNRTYYPKDDFFKNAVFPVIPTDEEIKKDILIPGHRFVPFYDRVLFQSELELIPENKSLPVGLKTVKAPIEFFASYHILLGGDDMINSYVADHEDNYDSLETGDPDAQINITVFNMKEFYKEHSFELGDILLLKCIDWDSGEFSFKYLKKAERHMEKKEEYVAEFRKGLEKVIRKHTDYFDIPEQLAYAFFYCGKKNLKKILLSTDETLNEIKNIDISFQNNGTTLKKYSSEEIKEDDFLSKRDDVSISQGDLSSLDSILRQIKCPLTSQELELLIKNEISNGLENPEQLIYKCLNHKNSDFADDAQKTVFLNCVEEMWEFFEENCSTLNGNKKSDVIQKAVSIIEDRLLFTAEIIEDKGHDAQMSPEIQKVLNTFNENFSSIVGLLNSDLDFENEEEAEEAYENLENAEKAQRELFRKTKEDL